MFVVDRRRRARERQQRVMADFAQKQRTFMEQNNLADMDISEDDAMSTSSFAETSQHAAAAAAATADQDKTYDCVICNQEATSTEQSPFGLVALLQPSSGQYRSMIVVIKDPAVDSRNMIFFKYLVVFLVFIIVCF